MKLTVTEWTRAEDMLARGDKRSKDLARLIAARTHGKRWGDTIAIGIRTKRDIALVEEARQRADFEDRMRDYVGKERFERLAAHQHVQWAGWTEYMLLRIARDIDDLLAADRKGTIDFEALPSVQRWRRQIATPYEHLPFDEQESDRREAADVIAVVWGE